jgi:hypothetical protein
MKSDDMRLQRCCGQRIPRALIAARRAPPFRAQNRPTGAFAILEWRRECQSIRIEASSIFTKTRDLSNSLKSLRAFRTVSSRRAAAAHNKNIENNPMQSSRRPPQPTVWAENLTRRANQRHNFTIPEFAERLRAQYGRDHVPRGQSLMNVG